MKEKWFTAVVLAAGKGKRMKSSLPKVLSLLQGKPLIDHVLRELFSLKSHVKQVIVVVGFKGDRVEKHVRKNFKNVTFVQQPHLWGTAHAVGCVEKKVKGKQVLVLCGDTPLVTKEGLRNFISGHNLKKRPCSVMTALMERKNSLGRIMRDRGGSICGIREKLDVNQSGAYREVNSGIYAFDRKVLFENLKKVKRNNKKHEFYLTDIIAILYRQGITIGSFVAENSDEIMGINVPSDLCRANRVLQDRILEGFMNKGVTIIDSRTTFIDAEVTIGKNSVIYPFTYIEKGVIIGSNCCVGPFIHLREGTRLADHAEAGNFLELCRSHIGKRVKIKHFGYMGDAVVEEDVNVGAGTVVANYDGKRKHKTVIKAGAFIGSDSVLVAPVVVGKKASTGAGSVVTRNVKPGTVAVGVPARFLKVKKG